MLRLFLFYFSLLYFFFVGDFYDETKSEDGQKAKRKRDLGVRSLEWKTVISSQ